MRFPFDPTAPVIAVDVEIVIGGASFLLEMILDTGATQTIVDSHVLSRYKSVPIATSVSQTITALGGSPAAREHELDRPTALANTHPMMRVLAMDTQMLGYDGLLGKDFLQNKVLTLDFRQGTIELI